MKFNITYKDITKHNPCYVPSKYIPEDWSGTLLDILDIKECPFEDRLWVVTLFLIDSIIDVTKWGHNLFKGNK